jgi:hypothetical protein
MRQTSVLALAAALMLTACHQGGGGGGPQGQNEGRSPVSYGNTNPISREQSSSKSLPLRAAPNNSGGQTQVGEGISNAKSTLIARGGQAVLKVNANKASAEQLQQVPGIGADSASVIVRNRPYKNADDMAKKTGISPNRVASYKQFLTF